MRSGHALIGLTCVAAIHATAEEPGKVGQYLGLLKKRPENAVLFGRLVDAWLESGEMAGLRERLETGAARGDAMDWRVLAVFRSFTGDEAGAIAALDEAARKAPDDGGTRLARAKALGAASRFEDALADLEAAAKSPDLALEAGTLRGKFLARAGRPADAVKAWQEVIAANPDDEGLREDLIDLEIGEGMLDEAVAAARDLAARTGDPYRKALRRMRVAEILAQAGKRQEAVEEYTAVFGVSADNSWLEREVLARVNALFSREDDPGGLREFHERLRDAWPRRVAVKKEAARSLIATGEGDGGVALFREVLKVMPGDRAARDEFIALLESAGRLKDAADEISALLATGENDAALWEKLAAIRKSQGDADGLKTALGRAVELAPQDEAGRVSAALLLERYGSPDEAEKTLREAAKAHGVAGEAGDALAVWLANHGKPDEAVDLWREVAKTADREGLLRVVRSLAANGRAAESYDILASRAADFRDDPLWLAAVCQAAQFSDKAADAIPQAIEWAKLAKTAGDLDAALRQAAALVSRAEEPREWIDKLASVAEPSIQELCLLAELHESQGDSIEAERVLKKAMEGGDPLLAAAQRVRLFELRGDLDAAVNATREWLALPGGLKTEQVKRLVSLQERRGDPDAALAETENWKRIAPGDKMVWTKRAELLRDNGKPEEAVAELRRALAKFGPDEEMRSRLAATLGEAGLNAEARQVYNALYEEAESPVSKVKWAGQLAELVSREGQEEELINDFKRRARDNPQSVAPLLALAEAYRVWQRPEDELETVAEASRRKPDDASLLHRLADLEEDSGSAEKAEALLKSAIRVRNTPENRRRLSAFWIRNGDSERGLAELLSNTGKSDPRDVERIVEPMMIAADHETALRVLTAETGRHPADWRLAYLHALALRETGAIDESLSRFIALLEAGGDLAGAVPLLQRNQMGWMYGNPVELTPFQQFSHFRNLTTRRRNNHHYHGSGQSPLPLPGTPAEARWMALCQALDIASLDADSRDKRMESITATDFPDLAFFKSVHGIAPDELAARMSRDDADPRLFRWHLESANYIYGPNTGGGVERKILREAAGRFAESDPELALRLLGRIGFDGGDGLDGDGARLLLDLVSKLPGDKRAGQLGYLQMIVGADDKLVPEDIKESASKLLLAGMKAASDKSGNTWIADSLAIAWMRAGRFDDAAGLLNQSYQMRNSPAVKAGQARQSASFGRYYSGGDGNLAFPDVLTSSVNHMFLSEFGVRGGGRGRSLTGSQKKLLKLLGEKEVTIPGMARADLKPIDVAKLANIVPKLEDPFLRVLFAHVSENADLAPKEIESLVEARAGDAESLLVAAAYKSSVGKDPVKTYELLVKAGDRAPAGPRRITIDNHIYRSGLALVAKGDAKADLEPARRAALRLRKSMAMDESTRRSLADGLAKLGLEEESKRYTAAAPARSPYSMGRLMGGIRQPGGRQNVNALIGQGKREAAARQLLRDIRTMSARVAMGGHPGYGEEQLYESIASLRLEDEIIRLSTPPEGAGFGSNRKFALLLSRLGKHEAALPVLRELAGQRPGDFEVKAALLMALPDDERKDFVLKLADAKFDSDRISQWFSQSLSRGGRKTFEEYLGNVELFVCFIENLPPSPEAERNLTWVNYFAKDLFSDYHFADNVRVRPLGRQHDRSDEVDKERTSTRDAVARRLHKAMLRHPQTAEQGFTLMMNCRRDLETAEADLIAAADDAFLNSASLREGPENTRMHGNRQQNLWVWRRGTSTSSRGSPPAEADPLSYLMIKSAEGRAPDPITPGFIARVGEISPEIAKIIGESEKIVSSPGLDAFNAWKDNAKGRPGDLQAGLSWIGRLASFRKRADILDALIDLSCDLALDPQGNSYAFSSGNAEGLSLAIGEASGLSEKNRVMARIANRLLGPPEAWPLYKEFRSFSVGTVHTRISLFRNIGQSMRNDRDSQVAMARFIAENRVNFGDNHDSSSMLSDGNWRRVGKDDDIVKDWLSSGIFDPGPAPACPSRENGKALFESMGSIVNNMGSENRGKVGEALLKTEGPRRFWARLLGARITGNGKAAVAELDANAKVIAKWPQHARDGLARLVINWFPDAAKNAGPSVAKLLDESRRKGDAEVIKTAEAYLKDGFPEDIQYYSISNGDIGIMMRRLIREDAGMAAKVWIKLLEHLESPQSRYSGTGLPGGPTHYSNTQLCQAFGDGSLSIASLADFILRVEKLKPGGTSGLMGGNQNYYQRRMFDAWLQAGSGAFAADREVATLKTEIRPLAGAILSLKREATKESKPLMLAILALQGLSSYSDIVRSSARADLLAWSRGNLRKSDPALADVVALIVLARQEKPSEADNREFRSAFAKMIGDAAIPAEVRVAIAAGALRESGARLVSGDASCIAALTELPEEHIRPETAWASGDMIGLLEKITGFKGVSADSCAKILAAIKAAPPSLANHGGSGDSTESRLARVMLALALAAGDSGEVAIRTRQSAHGFRGDLDLAAKLWQGKHTESALSLIARPGEYHLASRARLNGVRNRGEPAMTFSREMEESLSAWLSSIGEAGQRFRIECLLSALPDATGDAEPSVKRRERIAALVSRFPTEASQAKVSRDEILAALGTEPVVARPLADAYIEAAAKQKLGLLLALRDGNNNYDPRAADASYVTENIIRRAMRYETEVRGEASLVLDQLQSIIGVPGTNQEYMAREMLREFGRWYPAFVTLHIASQPEERRRALAAKALEMSDYLLIPSESELRPVAVAIAIASQAAAGDGAGLDRWLDKLPDPQKENYVTARKNDGLRGVFGGLRQAPFTLKDHEVQRREVLTRMLCDPATLAREITHMTEISSLMDSGAFTRDDIVAVIDSLPADHPRRAEFLTEKAGVIGWRTNNKDDALKAYDEAEAAAGGDAKLLDFVRSYRAMYLDSRADRTKDAIELAKTIDMDHLQERERKTVENLLKKAAPGKKGE